MWSRPISPVQHNTMISRVGQNSSPYAISETYGPEGGTHRRRQSSRGATAEAEAPLMLVEPRRCCRGKEGSGHMFETIDF
jgi:hypothetical protein